MDQRHDRLAGRLEVAMTHADGGFFVHAGEKLRHRVLAIVDDRLVEPAVARGRISRQILDVQSLDDIDHEVGAGFSACRLRHLRRAGLIGGDIGVWRKRRGYPRRRLGYRRGSRIHRPCNAGCTGNGCRGQKFAAIEFRVRTLCGHFPLPCFFSLRRRRPKQFESIITTASGTCPTGFKWPLIR